MALFRKLPNKIARQILLNLMKPLLNYLGYVKRDLDFRIPPSHYFIEEDALGSLNQIHKRYLKDTGWIESKNTNRSVRNGRFIPWTSYAFLHWIEERDYTKYRILEFGSGASTVFWSSCFRQVISIESDHEWFCKVKDACISISNVKLVFLLTNQEPRLRIEDYQLLESVFKRDLELFPELSFDFSEIDFLTIINEIKSTKFFFVDGGPKNMYLYLIGKFASIDSTIFVDNSDQIYTEAGRLELTRLGFKEIEFNSLGPLNHSATSTSVFVRHINQL